MRILSRTEALFTREGFLDYVRVVCVGGSSIFHHFPALAYYGVLLNVRGMWIE